jgi:adenine nucleotide transporter 17
MAQHNDTITSEILSSSFGGAVSTSILYPLEVLKTKMQVSDDDTDEESGEKKGMIKFAKDLYEKEGISVFYNGIETSACQSAMEKAFYFFAYTSLKNVHSTIRGILNPTNASKPIGGIANLALGW